MPLILFFVLSFLLFYLTYFFLQESCKKKKLPPGPPVFPLIGSVASLAFAHPEPHLALAKLAQKYGDVMRLRMGPHEYVVLSSVEALRDLLSKDESLGRPAHGALLDRTELPNTGIVSASGQPWRSKRAWIMRTFREMGIGRTSYFEESTRRMITELHSSLRTELRSTGNIVSIDKNTGLCTASMIWTLLVGSNTPEDIADCETFLRATNAWIEGGTFGDGITLLFPFLKHILPDFTNHTNHMNLSIQGRLIGQKLYNKLVNLKDTTSRNFFHSYIHEERSGRSGFSALDFRMTFTDIMIGSMDTTNSYIKSLLLFLTLYPEKQETLYQEIHRNFPQGHQFTMADLKLLPYTQAFILETHRLSLIITNFLPRTLTSDVTFRGYSLKKGTTLLPNPHVAFKSPVHFAPDPEAFRPERYIDPRDPNKLTQLRKLVTPFSIGKRTCPGESIAEIVSFLTLVSTVKHFRLSTVPGETPPTQKFTVGYLAKPLPFRVLVSPRQ